MLPTALILKPDGGVAIVGVTFKNAEEKRLTFRSVDLMCAQQKARGLIWACEMWVAGFDSREAAKRANLPKGLADYPARREGIGVLLLTHGWHEWRFIEIIRNEKKAIVEFKELAGRPNASEQRMFTYFD